MENHRALLRDLLGGPALRPPLHDDQLAPDGARGRVHREELRREGLHHLPRHGRSRRAISSHRSPTCAGRFMVDGDAPRLRLVGGGHRGAAVPSPFRTRSRARTCSTRRAPPAAPRASGSRPRASPSARRPRWCSLLKGLYGVDENAVYLSPAPLYHAAPLRFNLACSGSGPPASSWRSSTRAEALELIERHRVTHSQWVPTMFVRMLKLPEQERARYDVSSLRVAIHAAAPCPIPVKEQMIEWWGPVLYEYYAGTEANGFTSISSEDWLAHKGSVGQRPGSARSTSSTTTASELPPGEPGGVYFAGTGDLRVPQRSREDGRRAHRAGLVDDRRRRLPRRGGLPLPHRPQGRHDHLGRREHLSPGSGERARHPSRSWSTWRSSAFPTRSSARR